MVFEFPVILRGKIIGGFATKDRKEHKREFLFEFLVFLRGKMTGIFSTKEHRDHMDSAWRSVGFLGAVDQKS
jgi:hypothetical protein